MDWTRSSILGFIRGPVLHTPEGWAFAAGTLFSWLFGALGWAIPETVSRHPATGVGQALFFSIWPLGLFTAYMMLCAPDFRSARLTTLLMLFAASFPFWVVYA
jgi:hypothetical protein